MRAAETCPCGARLELDVVSLMIVQELAAFRETHEPCRNAGSLRDELDRALDRNGRLERELAIVRGQLPTLSASELLLVDVAFARALSDAPPDPLTADGHAELEALRQRVLSLLRATTRPSS